MKSKTQSILFVYISSEYENYEWPEESIKVNLIDEDLISSDEENEIEERQQKQANPENGSIQPIDFDMNVFKTFLNRKIPLITELFKVVKVVSRKNLTFEDVDLRYENFGAARDAFILFCNGDKFDEIPLSERAQKVGKVFIYFMDEFMKIRYA